MDSIIAISILGSASSGERRETEPRSQPVMPLALGIYPIDPRRTTDPSQAPQVVYLTRGRTKYAEYPEEILNSNEIILVRRGQQGAYGLSINGATFRDRLKMKPPTEEIQFGAGIYVTKLEANPPHENRYRIRLDQAIMAAHKVKCVLQIITPTKRVIADVELCVVTGDKAQEIKKNELRADIDRLTKRGFQPRRT